MTNMSFADSGSRVREIAKQRSMAGLAHFVALCAIAFVFICGQKTWAVPAGWTVDFVAAKKEAAQGNHDLLLKFTGSDWCIPCKQLQQGVFEKPVFKADAAKWLKLVYVDYPRKKGVQTPPTVAQNKALMKLFSITDYPTVVLADAQGLPYAKLETYLDETPGEYVAKLKTYRAIKLLRDAHFKKATQEKGIAKAKSLHAGLEAIDPTLLLGSYSSQIKEIIALDVDGKAGYKAFYQPLAKLTQVREAIYEVEDADIEIADKKQRAIARINMLGGLAVKVKAAGHVLQEIWYAKARVAYLAGLEDLAKKSLQQAIDIVPKSPTASEMRTLLKDAFK